MSFFKSCYVVEFTDVKGNEKVDTLFDSFEQALAVANIGKNKKGNQRPYIIKLHESAFPKDFGNVALEESYSTYKTAYSDEDEKVLEDEINTFHENANSTGAIVRLRDKLLNAYFDWLAEEDISLPYAIVSAVWDSETNEWTNYVV